MKTLERIFDTVIPKLGKISKPQKDFLLELLKVVFSLYGRGNFLNFARYTCYNESTFRRNFVKYFNWVELNYTLLNLYLSPSDIQIGAIDCSFIPKSGKNTFGVDKFWSGSASKAIKGLEISLLCLITVSSQTAWALDVCQTPAHLKNKESTPNQYTRIDFYLEQFLDCLGKLTNVKYFVADGFYAKTKVFNTFVKEKKHLITRLRSDSNLRFLYTAEHKKGKQGRKPQFDGKVKFDDLAKWYFEGIDDKYSHLHLYSQVLNSPHFKRNLKVVLVLNSRTNKYILLASTDIEQEAREILTYYQLRFQIEFLFRDAKQFSCLNHCQARDENKLDFHFNMSLTAINFSRAVRITEQTKSLNNFVREAYNNKFLDFVLSKLRINQKLILNEQIKKEICRFGIMEET